MVNRVAMRWSRAAKMPMRSCRFSLGCPMPKVSFRLTDACDQSRHTCGRASKETKYTARATAAATMIVHATTRRRRA